MKIKALLLAGAMVLTGGLRADNTLDGNHTVTGNLTVGDSGTNRNLTVTGTSLLNGRVGAGTSSPGAQLHVQSGSATTKSVIIQGAASQSANLLEWQSSGGTAFGSINSVGNITLNATPSENMKIYVRQTGAASGSYYYGARFDTDPGGSGLARAYGIYAQATGYNNTTDYVSGMEMRGLAVGTSGTLPRMVALSGYAFDTATGLTIVNSYGVIGSTGFYSGGSTGVMTNAYGVVAEAGYPLTSGQTQTNATGVYVNVNATEAGRGIHINSVNSGSSAYGIQLNTVISGSGGQNYGLYIFGGSNNFINGNVGIGTSTPNAKLDVVGNVKISGSLTVSGSSAFASSSANGFVFGGTYGSGTIPIEGAGARVMWQPSKGAFRAGVVSGTQWNNSLVGAYSIGMGYNVVASGSNSVAMGVGSVASASGAVALGYANAAGTKAVALGGGFAIGNNSFATGYGAYASGDNSISLGENTYAEESSVAIGDNASANGISSAALGANTAMGNQATALGHNTYSMGIASVTLGYGSFAVGDYSSSLGVGTYSQTAYCQVLGMYNVMEGSSNSYVETDPLLVVGNGTGNAEDPPEVERRNALVVYKNGDVKIPKAQGDISMGEFGE